MEGKREPVFDNPAYKPEENEYVKPEEAQESSRNISGPANSGSINGTKSTTNGSEVQIPGIYTTKSTANDDKPKSHACMWITIGGVCIGALAVIIITIYYAEVLENRNKLAVRRAKHFSGSVKVIGGPYSIYSSKMADKTSTTYQYFSQNFQYQIDHVFRKSKYAGQYHKTAITELLKGSVVVKFTMHFHSDIPFQTHESSAFELVKILRDSLDKDGRVGAFVLDSASIVIEDSAKKTPASPPASPKPTPPVILGKCLEIQESSTCSGQKYNATSFPNYLGHNTSDVAETWASTFSVVMENSFHCYDLVKIFACATALPKCSNNTNVPPCRRLCEETWSRCSFALPLVLPFVGELWPSALNCSHFPDSVDPAVCVGGTEMSQVFPPKCPAKEVTCANDNTTCIPRDWVCDGHVDCGDGSDEKYCGVCGRTQHRCQFGQCIDKSAVCDGKADCYGATDENDCVYLAGTHNGQGLVRLKTGLQHPGVCAQSWNHTYSSILCQQLGYQSENTSWNSSASADPFVAVVADIKPEASAEYLQSRIKANGSCPERENVYVSCGQKECGKRPAHLPSRQRVLGGNKAKPGDWPWLVSLHGGPAEAFFCAGSVINDQWILTAAHCLAKSTMTIRAGVMRRDTYSPYLQTRISLRLIRHPNYQASTNDNDIGLIQLNETLRFTDYVQPICLPNSAQKLDVGEPTYAIGWGKTSSTAYDYERVVGGIGLSITPRDECEAIVSRELPGVHVTDNMICAGGVRGRDSCFGDSGGPMMYHNQTSGRWIEEGIVSFGVECGKIRVPGVYTNVRAYLKWVNDIVTNIRDTT